MKDANDRKKRGNAYTIIVLTPPQQTRSTDISWCSYQDSTEVGLQATRRKIWTGLNLFLTGYNGGL